MSKRKAFTRLRIGFQDHLPDMNSQRDAVAVYIWALQRSPLDGPSEGTIRIHQSDLAAFMRISRQRVSRAIKYLTTHPSRERAWLQRLDGPSSGAGIKYQIRNHDGSDPGASECLSGSQQKAKVRAADVPYMSTGGNGFVSPDVPEVSTEPDFVSPDVPEVSTDKLYGRARLKIKSKRDQEVSDAMKEVGDWVIVADENEARQVLMHRLGMSNIEDKEFREKVITEAMQNLQHYHIGFEEPDDNQDAIDNIVELKQPEPDEVPTDAYEGETETDEDPEAWEMPF